MTQTMVAPYGKRLKNLKKILWIVFASITIATLLCGALTVPVLFLASADPGFSPPPGMGIGMLLFAIAVSLIIFIGGVGVVCLLIYNITKARLEKDEDLFL